MQSEGDSAPVSRQRLDGLAVLEYRTKVVDRLGVTAEWRGLDWADQAACANQITAAPRLCGRCPGASPVATVPECLAAAVTTDDHAAWRGSLSRADRENIWAAMERTYVEVPDLELMRMDASRLPHRRIVDRLDDGFKNGWAAHDHL